jgi:acyl phosphate:glycerol-3-phosphate acyltransferase
MSIFIIVLGYMIGSLPMGYILVKLFKGKDITKVGSGRTGGTNAMRVGGVWVGLLTSLIDFLKGLITIILAQWIVPDSTWVSVLAGVASVLGHNWSIWLYFITKRFSAGAGTGPNVGVATAFWPGITLVVIPIIIIFVFIVGYASLASITAAVVIIGIFLFRAMYMGDPFEYFYYSLMSGLIVVWALRPNIRNLLYGKERRVGLFAKPKGRQ